MAETPDQRKLTRIDRKVFWQRLLLAGSVVWNGAQYTIAVAALGFVLVASGVLLHLPQLAQLAILILAASLFLVSLWPLRKFHWPSRTSALRHMEQASSIADRKLSSIDDMQANTSANNPATDMLWEEHRRRQMARLGKVKLLLPPSRWRDFDPRALRVPIAMACVAAFFLGPNDPLTNLQESARLSKPVAPVPLVIDAWLKPPSYTGRPPILLTSQQIAARIASGSPVEVPENAVFSLRTTGAKEPVLTLLASEGGTPLEEPTLKQATKDGTLTAEAKIIRPLTIVLSDGATELARWPLSTIPDRAPVLELSGDPTGDSKGNLTVKWKAKDDYGLKKIMATLDLADEQGDGTGFESNGIFLFDAPELKPVLKRANAKEENGTSRFDLASHPWAGLQVTLNMSVTDGSGQAGSIKPVSFRMPERLFVKPLPRALIEQRKQLILFPERAVHVGTLIDTLALYPRGLFEGASPVIAMGAISSRLRNATGYDDVKLAINDLWELAVKLEDGALSDAKAELQQLKAELEKALREGAPQERIAELTKKLREAMDRYLDAMREEAEKRMKEGNLQPNQNGGESRSISREDLEKMLDALEDLSKGGANDMAEELLNQLDQLLQNLQPGQGSESADGAGEMDGMMKDLGDLMRRQQKLMDETQRMPNGQQPGENGEGSKGQQGQGSGGDELSERQRELSRRLEGMLGQGELPGGMKDAGKDMEGAADALREGDREGALQKQGEALDKLRKGARDLAQRMREQGQGQAGGQARDGEGRGGDDDPLGRPRATRNPDEGPREDIVPGEQAIQRAREILESLRAKANERGLTDQEKAYIDRLLRGLY